MDYGKYKNALEKAKVRYNEIKGTNCNEEKFLLDLFPELKENKDRIRQGLIKALSSIGKRNWGGIDVFESIAWLEKQKVTDKEIVFRPLAGTDIITAARQALEKIEIGKEVVLAFNGAYIPVNGKTVAEICNEYFAWTEKQGEKKVSSVDFKAKDWYVSNVDGKIHDMTYNPTDKVEPKFHEGDWIVNDYCSGKVIALTDDAYLLDTGQGIPFSCEHNAHLWTIQDAKDGDVLYSLDSKQPFIFKHRKPNEQAAVYCGINTYGKFFIGNTKDCIITLSNYVPATRAQRDLLFKKMQEAGYEWDAEKKELKLLISNGGDFESNNSKQKPSWSEEDEKIITALIEGFRYHQLFNPTFGEVPNAEIISWIKSLKERLL